MRNRSVVAVNLEVVLALLTADSAADTPSAAMNSVRPGHTEAHCVLAMVRLHRARTALKVRLKAHCGTTSARSCADCGCEERGCCPLP